ncbi:MAG: DNA/RNA non-specific endonuclease [Clostridia bacterium]|nr:DNA/RNA non-specific endonuclease [Clostridia bacterium]
MNKYYKRIITVVVIVVLALIIQHFYPDVIKIGEQDNTVKTSQSQTLHSYEIADIPEYKNEPFVYINDNNPNFTEEDYTTESFEKYSELDSLGRCGVAYANVCRAIMPPEGDKRGEISSVRPSGWKQKKYDGEYLYNRCHLIGYQLSDEDANKQNLITGTRYFNVTGMLPFENQVADYIKHQAKGEDKHILYRVTPIYKDNNLVANGVEMEAYSVEDNGEGVKFNVFVYNVQPGIKINYETGESNKE